MLELHPTGRLLRYVEGELPPRAAAEVAAHLAGCERCRAELEEVRFGAYAASQLPAHSAPPGLWSGIEAALDARPAPARWMLAPAAALLATVLIAVVLLQPQPQGGWRVERIEDAGSVAAARAASGDWIETGPAGRARIQIGSIGHVEVAPGSSVRLIRTHATGHRLALLRGGIEARIWAPPRLFFVETPSALAVDLGCVYTLTVDDAGDALLRVAAGWVLLEDRGRESMVPAGALCRTRRGAGPGLPAFEDAPAALHDALAAFDSGAGSPALDALLRNARPRDTLTLFHLLPRVSAPHRPAVYERLAELAPSRVIGREEALALDPAALARWLDELAWEW